jgi:hypothetical protein
MRKMIVAILLAVLTGGGSAMAQGQIWEDPPAYCRVYPTIDHPDSHYAGNLVPEWMMAAFFKPQEIAAFRDGKKPFYGINWRCVQGEVFACANAQTPTCMKAGTNRTPSEAMRDFCKDGQHDGQPVPRVVTGTARMLAYDWVCRGREPAIAKETPLDPQGFVAADWKRVAPR